MHAGQDHLSQFTNRKPVDALVELIWNGLDAEADLVTVDFETASIAPGDRELLHIAGITVEDNGHGISAEVANRAFPSLGDSWKKSLNGRTLNGKRALHGSRGRGRFFAYSLGHRVQWSSVCQEPDGSFTGPSSAAIRPRLTDTQSANPLPLADRQGQSSPSRSNKVACLPLSCERTCPSA